MTFAAIAVNGNWARLWPSNMNRFDANSDSHLVALLGVWARPQAARPAAADRSAENVSEVVEAQLEARTSVH